MNGLGVIFEGAIMGSSLWSFSGGLWGLETVWGQDLGAAVIRGLDLWALELGKTVWGLNLGLTG